MTAAAPEKPTATGRPLRVLLLLALALGVWLMLRLPILQREMAQTRRDLAPGAAYPAASPLRLVSASAADFPAASANPGGDIAMAQAELGVAEAELGVARARLRLVQIAHGGGYAPPSLQLPVAGPPIATVMAARRVDTAPGADGVRRTTWSLPPRSPAKATALASTRSVAPAPVAPSPGHDLATAAYARLAEGDRRGAARLFDAALASDPATDGDPRRAEWQAERRRLGRRWSGDAYALFRDGGAVGAAASPVLGGGQTGGSLAWTLDPLARRPVAVVARFNAATESNGALDNSSSQAAFGLRWRPRPGVSISAERLVAIGETARNDWALRVAGGADGKRGRIEWTGYGEAGVLGAGDVFVGAQARAAVPVYRSAKAAFLAGAGAWTSIQSGGVTSGRFDVGPSLVMRTPMGRIDVDVSADWRFRVAGNALPGSGPALTMSTGF